MARVRRARGEVSYGGHWGSVVEEDEWTCELGLGWDV